MAAEGTGEPPRGGASIATSGAAVHAGDAMVPGAGWPLATVRELIDRQVAGAPGCGLCDRYRRWRDHLRQLAASCRDVVRRLEALGSLAR